MTALPTTTLRGKLPVLSLVVDEPTIDPAEMDLYFPQIEYSEAELEEMYADHLNEGVESEFAPLPEPTPVLNRPASINWRLFARPATVLSRECAGGMAVLSLEDNVGNRYVSSDLASRYADIQPGFNGFVIPEGEGDAWRFHRRLPEPPKPAEPCPAGDEIPF